MLQKKILLTFLFVIFIIFLATSSYISLISPFDNEDGPMTSVSTVAAADPSPITHSDIDFSSVSISTSDGSRLSVDYDLSTDNSMPGTWTNYSVNINEVTLRDEDESGGNNSETTKINVGSDNFKISSIITSLPEPPTIFLFGVGLIGLAGYGRRKFKK